MLSRCFAAEGVPSPRPSFFSAPKRGSSSDRDRRDSAAAVDERAHAARAWMHPSSVSSPRDTAPPGGPAASLPLQDAETRPESIPRTPASHRASTLAEVLARVRVIHTRHWQEGSEIFLSWLWECCISSGAAARASSACSRRSPFTIFTAVRRAPRWTLVGKKSRNDRLATSPPASRQADGHSFESSSSAWRLCSARSMYSTERRRAHRACAPPAPATICAAWGAVSMR